MSNNPGWYAVNYICLNKSYTDYIEITDKYEQIIEILNTFPERMKNREKDETIEMIVDEDTDQLRNIVTKMCEQMGGTYSNIDETMDILDTVKDDLIEHLNTINIDDANEKLEKYIMKKRSKVIKLINKKFEEAKIDLERKGEFGRR